MKPHFDILSPSMITRPCRWWMSRFLGYHLFRKLWTSTNTKVRLLALFFNNFESLWHEALQVGCTTQRNVCIKYQPLKNHLIIRGTHSIQCIVEVHSWLHVILAFCWSIDLTVIRVWVWITPELQLLPSPSPARDELRWSLHLRAGFKFELLGRVFRVKFIWNCDQLSDKKHLSHRVACGLFWL